MVCSGQTVSNAQCLAEARTTIPQLALPLPKHGLDACLGCAITLVASPQTAPVMLLWRHRSWTAPLA